MRIDSCQRPLQKSRVGLRYRFSPTKTQRIAPTGIGSVRNSSRVEKRSRRGARCFFCDRPGRFKNKPPVYFSFLSVSKRVAAPLNFPFHAISLPILDLCQYIFLTRVCKTAEWPDVSGELQNRLDYFWHLKDEKGRRRKTKARQIALLRAQRTRHGVHHDRGAVFVQSKEGKIERLDGTGTGDDPKVEENFEYRWLQYGDKWEHDTSLLS